MNNKRNTMRELNDVEKKLINKNLIRIKEDLEYKEIVQLAKLQYILDTAEVSVKKQIKDTEKEKRVVTSEIDEHKKLIETLEIQLTKGVKLKK